LLATSFTTLVAHLVGLVAAFGLAYTHDLSLIDYPPIVSCFTPNNNFSSRFIFFKFGAV
jgi:hypothetical protein